MAQLYELLSSDRGPLQHEFGYQNSYGATLQSVSPARTISASRA